jgi:hypothetical protein
MAQNLAADWRVSPEREKSFLDLDFMDGEPATIQEWLATYFVKLVREASVPHFLLEHNRPNRRPEILPETEMVQIFRVSTLLPEVIGRVVERMSVTPPHLLEIRDIAPNKEASEWVIAVLQALFPPPLGIEDNINGLGAADNAMRHEFIEELWTLLDEASPNYHPNWVALWDEFKGYRNEPADVWLAMMGKPSPKRACLCLVLRYQAGEVSPSLRPTILDVGWYAPHFPSPPTACGWKSTFGNRPSGGHPVNFDRTARPLLQEFIHRNVAKKREWVVGWGWTTTDYNDKDLALARSDHLEALGRSYDKIDRWMPFASE